jgi:hypothetical protein
MERNTVIGIILLGLLLTVFTIVNQPSEEELKEQQKKELTLSFENPNLSAEDLLKKSKDLEEVIKNLALLEEKWLALMM